MAQLNYNGLNGQSAKDYAITYMDVNYSGLITPADSGSFALVVQRCTSGSFNNFTSNGSGLLTYNGQGGTFLVQAGLSITPSTGNISGHYHRVAINGSTKPESEIMVDSTGATATASPVLSYITPLANGSTISVYSTTDISGTSLRYRTFTLSAIKI